MSLSALFFYAVIGLATFLLWKLRKRLTYWQSLGIACEQPQFLIGNLTGLYTTRSFNDIWMNYYNKFKGTGPFAGFYWFQSPAVFVLEPSLVKQILIKDFNKFTDRGLFSNEKDDPLTGHIFLLDGHKWRNMRTKLSPTFTSAKMKIMFPAMASIGEEFVKVCNDMVQQNSVLEVRDIMARFTCDVIGTCAFGIDCNSLKETDSMFLKMGRKSVTEFRYGILRASFRSSFPLLARKLHMKTTPQYIEDYFLGLARKTVTHREQSKERKNDFMDMLIDLKNNKMMKSEDGEEMTNITFKELAAQAFLFLVAGFETSSTTMGFVLYELAQHEDIQQRVRKEFNEVLDRHNQELTYECMKEMQYMDQVISETLRLYTVLPVINRVCLEDYVVPGYPKYTMKKGMPIIIPSSAIHRDERFYAKPNEFNPDNFSPEMIQQRNSADWLPFGDGPRNCIGMRFGRMQMRIGLGLLLRNFKFTVCAQTEIPIKYDKKSFLISAESGIYLEVKRL